jgi:dTMP kinase
MAIVCIEGLDGSGKTTQCAILAGRLRAKLWKFPNKDSPTGKLIYEHLAGTWSTHSEDDVQKGIDVAREKHIDALVFQALQVANRMEVASQLFEDAAAGNVVMDRYWPSGYAYGKADGLDGEYLIGLHRWLPQPDLFILLDSTPELLAKRRPEARDRYERNAEHLWQVANNYRELWKQMAHEGSPDRWVIVSKTGLEEVTHEIASAVAAWKERRTT